MNSPVEDRLREALADAGATIDTSTLRPLRSPERRRFRVDLRMVSVATAVVLAGTATFTAFGTGGGDQDRAVAVSPQVVQDREAELVVFLCTAPSKQVQCGDGDVTPGRIKEIETTLRGLPQVKSVVYTSRTSAYESLRKDFARNKAVLKEVKITDLPASFTVRLRKGADLREVTDKLRLVAGIRDFVDPASAPPWPRTAELLKWPIKVFLCSKGTALPACGAVRVNGENGDIKVTKEGKGATPAEKKALEELIRKMPEVAEYEFVSQKAAYEQFQEQYKANETLLGATRVKDMPRAFRLRLKQESSWQDVLAEVREQPGVAQVVYLPCPAEMSALQFDFGVALPESAVCPASS
ncbi:permease-like cell division protein FtsX [Nonomuraea fuscirosea]|uniref:permease-like cell division protein FtsX n=1 Tax=Nonomuraea fuscirosea TaxID=1291556 RepID=UPI00342932BB